MTPKLGSGARVAPETWERLARDAWLNGQREQARGELGLARRWLERAVRLAPQDGLARLSLAGVLLASGELQAAADAFRDVAERHRVPDALIGLAACALRVRDLEAARSATEAALRCSVPTPALRSIAQSVAEHLGLPGWCGLDGEGSWHAGPARPDLVAIDGRPIEGPRLPRNWRAGRSLDVRGSGVPFLGSPIPIGAVIAVEGFVEPADGGVAGWAWHPADPGRDPTLTVQGPLGRLTVIASEPAQGVLARPLVRPRRFALSADQAAALGHPVSVTDASGRHLLGSPLDPAYDQRPGFAPIWADRVGTSPRSGRPADVDVVIPVYRGTAETLACLRSVIATVAAPSVIHVVDDRSPEPALVEALLGLQASGRVRLIRQAENRGFPAAANAGLKAAAGRDVVLLNSDTLVAPGWLERLRRAAYAAPDIGTATPLSNDATIVSYPDPDGGNPMPDLRGTRRLDGVAQKANGGRVAELPVGVGFCLYLRRDCLDQVGALRTDLFAQGYGEENDFCLRARQAGWRHVAALDVFVAHAGGRSFGGARAYLMQRNGRVLNRLHPGYDALVEAHVAADPLGEARRRMDALRWAAGRRREGAVLLVTHAEGGGVEEVLQSRCRALREGGLRPVILRPATGGCRVEADDGRFPNLTYALPTELAGLAALLRPDRPLHLEQHHLLGHCHAVLDVARLLGIPTEVWAHDYASFCPRVSLVSRERRYCGEPEVRDCEDCIADLGSKLAEDIEVRALLARSAADLAASRRVVSPSADAAQRLRRHFPAVRPEVRPWQNDRELPPPVPQAARPVSRVCLVGAIGIEKGYDVLLGCVRDAARRELPLEFVLCGFTIDDERLLAAGPVFITGQYAAEEAVSLIQSQRAHLAFVPSVTPETWCFALSRLWQAGLQAVAFDLGAQAERIRGTGRGRLLPLGLPPRAINDALLSLAPPSLTPPSLTPPSVTPPRLAQPGAPSQSPPRSGP